MSGCTQSTLEDVHDSAASANRHRSVRIRHIRLPTRVHRYGIVVRDGNSEEWEMAKQRSDERLIGAEREQAIIELIRSVPEGFVTTYGDLCPEAPRLPGRILATTEEVLPWHRIVRADGSFAKGERQRRLLRREGIPFAGKRVEMETAHIPREALLANR